MSTLNAEIYILANTSANFTASNFTLGTGRFALETDTGLIKCGANVPYNNTGYINSPEPAIWNIWAPGKMLANETISRILITSDTQSTIPSGGAGTAANATVAANATTVVDIRKNGSSVGNFTWSAAATTANVTIASNVTLSSGDILSLVAPATPDANLTGVSYTIRGNR